MGGGRETLWMLRMLRSRAMRKKIGFFFSLCLFSFRASSHAAASHLRQETDFIQHHL